MPAAIVEAIGDQVMHALPAHVGEVHGAGRAAAWASFSAFPFRFLLPFGRQLKVALPELLISRDAGDPFAMAGLGKAILRSFFGFLFRCCGRCHRRAGRVRRTRVTIMRIKSSRNTRPLDNDLLLPKVIGG
jgi:hypothetical protein